MRRSLPLILFLLSASQAAAAGFDSPGFNSGGFNAPARPRVGITPAGFNAPGFNSDRFSRPGASESDGCGRMLVPAASLAVMSRGFANGHAGMDIAAEHGSPVRAAAGGIVSFAGNDPAYGLFVDIKHPNNLLTRYGHLSAFAAGITAGAGVRAGTVIGRIGATGNANGAHLHFEVRTSGQAIDPKPFLVGADCAQRPARPEILEARAPDTRRPGRNAATTR